VARLVVFATFLGCAIARAGPPTSTAVNRAIGYQATKLNETLFDKQASENQQVGDHVVKMNPDGSFQVTDGPGAILSQKDAQLAQNQTLLACSATNLSGRKDAACANDPNHPECTGMTASLGNAANCAKPGPTDPKTGQPTCLEYGAFGYTGVEWLTFGQQYYDGLTGCFAVGAGPDPTGIAADPNKMVSRALRLGGLDNFAPPTVGASGSGAGPLSASDITGTDRKNDAQAEALAAQYDDGAGYLGLERGDLIRSAAAGKSFLSVFTESPFATALDAAKREATIAALAEPAATKTKVRIAKDESEAMPPASAAKKAGLALAFEGAGAGGRRERDLAAASALLGAPVPSHIRPNKERDLAAARALLGDAPLPARAASAASPVLPGRELGGLEATLFERVSLSYRRHAPSLQSLGDSKTARDVRLTEEPAFFKDL